MERVLHAHTVEQVKQTASRDLQPVSPETIGSGVSLVIESAKSAFRLSSQHARLEVRGSIAALENLHRMQSLEL